MVAITAAVSRGEESPFTFEELELEAPRADELLVRITAAGVCHTDLRVLEGAVPARWPSVLGHEGAGIVEEVGSAVSDIRPGDRVLLSFAWCGHCASCHGGRPMYCDDFFRLNFGCAREDGSTTMTAGDGSVVNAPFFGQSSFATHSVVAARDVVKVPDEIPLELAAPLGCGIETGAGAIINALSVGIGASLVVSGCGPVGLAAVMAARVVGASPIIAVDILQSRLDLALELGATHAIDGRDHDLVTRVQEITGDGVDFSFDTTGVPNVVLSGLQSVKPGGCAGLVAGSPEGSTIPLAALTRKTVRHTLQGDSVPRVFLPQLFDLHRRGDFPLDRLVTTYPFADIERAIADTQSGAAVKAVLTMP